jgi:hypothetical protein
MRHDFCVAQQHPTRLGLTLIWPNAVISLCTIWCNTKIVFCVNTPLNTVTVDGLETSLISHAYQAQGGRESTGNTNLSRNN